MTDGVARELEQAEARLAEAERAMHDGYVEWFQSKRALRLEESYRETAQG